MSADQRTISVAHEWIVKAENDLITAAHTLKLGPESPTDTVCFHAQQCVEKYLKALLVLSGLEVPWTHNISKLLSAVPSGTRPDLTPEQMKALTTYATTSRYPGQNESIPLAEARRAVALARRVRREIRRHFPSKALRRPRR